MDLCIRMEQSRTQTRGPASVFSTSQIKIIVKLHFFRLILIHDRLNKEILRLLFLIYIFHHQKKMLKCKEKDTILIRLGL